MPNVVVVGAQWGDEGKGKIVDIYSREADVVVRFQGGNNAGHTLVVEGRKIILRHIPSGILHDGKTCVIGGGVVIDPVVLLQELERLAERGISVTPANFFISEKAHVILPCHKELDKAREEAACGAKIGTTGRGIGPCYEDKASRRGIRMGDLKKPARLRERLENLMREKNALLTSLYGTGACDVETIYATLMEQAKILAPFIADTTALLAKWRGENKKILFEGAQGALLDIDHGTYPFVTSSNTVSGNAATGSGVGPCELNQVIGITKAYVTRVGEGPFPTELKDEAGERLRVSGAEFGSTTGRPRRCGWLDLVALKYAAALNGLTGLAVTKIDVLDGLPEVKLGVAYEVCGEVTETFPGDIEDICAAKPVYKSFPGWSATLSGLKSIDELPKEARELLDFISSYVGVPVVLASVGPGREQSLELKSPFAC